MNSPQLLDTDVPRDPAAVVLVLHGGASRGGSPMVSPTQLSVLRMVPIARRIARAAAGQLAVLRLLNSTRGWDTSHTPVDDADWALERCRERFGTLPVGLVGHSLGGRAALLAGDRPPVRSVVALNPWVYPSDHADLRGRSVLIAHGTRDRIARPERSAHVARHLGAAQVTYVRVRGGKHAMLARHATFDALAADFTASALLDIDPGGPVSAIRSGQTDLDV